MDDFALFSNGKRALWAWKQRFVERLAALRLTIHEGPAQVTPVAAGIPWLGFVVYPDHRRVKAHKVRSSTRHLADRLDDYQAGRIGFGKFDASVQAGSIMFDTPTPGACGSMCWGACASRGSRRRAPEWPLQTRGTEISDSEVRDSIDGGARNSPENQEG